MSQTIELDDSLLDRAARKRRNRFGALCEVCKSRVVAIVAVGFAAHWILELIAVAAIARLACN